MAQPRPSVRWFTITRIFNFIEKKLEGKKNYNLMANQVQVGTPKDAGANN